MNVVTAGDLALTEEEDAQLVPPRPVDVPKKRSDLLSIIDFGECSVLDSHRPLSREDFDDPGMQQQERTSPPRGRLFAAADGVNMIDAATVHPSDLFSDLVTDDEKRHGDAASRLAAANRKRELSVFDFVPSDEDVRKKPPIPPVPGFVEQLQLIHGLDPFYGVSGDSDSSCGDTGKIEEPATVVRRRRVRNYGKTVRGPKISKVIRVSDDDEWKYDDEDDEWNDPASDSGSEIVSVKDKTVRCTHGKDRSTVKRRIDVRSPPPSYISDKYIIIPEQADGAREAHSFSYQVQRGILCDLFSF